MKNIKLIGLTLLILIAPFAFVVHADEMKQDATSTTGAQVKPDVKAAEAIPATIDHNITVKSFIAHVGADGVQHVEIVGGEYYFDPNYIIVKVNVPVEFKVKKAGGYIPHDIMVKAPQAGMDFKVSLSNEWQTIKFTPTKVGKYEMYCDKRLLWFESHKDKGMDGFIEVVP
jgi:plastocyanin